MNITTKRVESPKPPIDRVILDLSLSEASDLAVALSRLVGHNVGGIFLMLRGTLDAG